MPHLLTSHSTLTEASYHSMSTGRLGAGDTAIQPTILDAKGDLIVATAADTPARLAVGSANQTLLADSAQATGIKWGSSPQSLMTATGDLLYASSANTPARLGIGSTGQVLGVSGGVPAWTTGSALTYITGTTFTSVSSFSLPTNTFTSTYKNYKIFLYFTGYTTASALTIRCRTNGTDYTGSQYFYGTARQGYAISYTATTGSAVSSWQIGLGDYYDRSALEFTYFDPKGGGYSLTFTGMVDNIGGAFGGLYQNGTSNVDSLTFAKASGNMSGYYRVYGLADA